ncbi:MAG TPA: S9 family peptidase [Verrucomicrobiae bacterium]|jgi:dipeptidyl aminopeptidase/acylaminoacyl peptidase|nr:S9 family peptidase [Verrucomicrobiae bacterium]
MRQRFNAMLFRVSVCLSCAALLTAIATPAFAQVLTSSDLSRLRSIGSAAISPDGHYIAYSITMRDRPGRPYGQLWVMDISTAKSVRLGGENPATAPLWSNDSKWIAFRGEEGDKHGLLIAHPDGSGTIFLTALAGTNSPLPERGKDVAWSPDGKQIAFVSSTPGEGSDEASGDPMVITRYLYKPDYTEGMTRFNDNQRLHIFVVDTASKQVRQLTRGNYDEHSIDWSPDGKQLVFASNREPNQDEFFNYDLFTLQLADNSIHRLTATEYCEYDPLWSPDGKSIIYLGTRRGLTDRETTMEDTHVWLMNADGGNRREIGNVIDNRQGAPQWAPDGSAVYFTVAERGSNHLVRLPVSGGPPEYIVKDAGVVSGWSVGKNGAVAYAFITLRDASQLYYKSGSAASRKLTDLNQELLAGKPIAEVESFTFVSNDNRFEVEAFLTKPIGMTATSKHPLIVVIHGGPHGQNGPGFFFKNQVYAAHGYAVLNVNYRGSIGYGQKFADAVFGDQDGNEGQDVLYAVSAAVRRYLWIDRERMGIEGVSYGGQLTDWLITQTNEFKAAIPTAGIANLVSYNYMTYYNQYEEMEFGQFLHQGNLMDVAWERSALKHIAAAHTPTLIIHGENDNDVPIAEAEQLFVALKDAGVETVFLRYPREGHGLSEVKHQIDATDRSIAWYERHFPKPSDEGVTNVQP